MDHKRRRKKYRIPTLESEISNTASLINELYTEIKNFEAKLRTL